MRIAFSASHAWIDIRHLGLGGISSNTSLRRCMSVASSDATLIHRLLRNPELSEADARNELRWIRQAATAANPTRSESVTAVDESRQASRASTIAKLVERRGDGEPLQYILGTTDFGPLELLVRPPTLIPRPETAHITERLISAIRSSQPTAVPLRILDLCSGSGCIALLLAHELGSDISVRGIDVSPHAVSLARDNAEKLGLDVKFEQADLWGDKTIKAIDKVDMVVSNPPYIPLSEWEGLSKSVKEHEDPLALIGDPEDVSDRTRQSTRIAITHIRTGRNDGKGLAFYRRIAHVFPDLLTEGARTKATDLPIVAVEVGMGQAQDVARIFTSESRGLVKRTEIWKDQYDVDRMVVGYGPSRS